MGNNIYGSRGRNIIYLNEESKYQIQALEITIKLYEVKH
jgi:hypothetical protein